MASDPGDTHLDEHYRDEHRRGLALTFLPIVCHALILVASHASPGHKDYYPEGKR
jgi:hypothetical protein